MLALPTARVLTKRAIEFVAPDDRFAQDREHERRLLICGPVQLAHFVGLRDHWLLAARQCRRGVRGEELAPYAIAYGVPLKNASAAS